MDDSRRPPSPDPGSGGTTEVLQAALETALFLLPAGTQRLAVAASGGPDSVALAIVAAQLARQRGWELQLFHVHHGLQTLADDWAGQTRLLADMLGVVCQVARVNVDLGQGLGVEAAARQARYAALAQLAGQHRVQHVLLAHHQDDQAETVLMRLLRGAGPDGMGAMAPMTRRDGVTYLRPWLDVPRSCLLAVVQAFTDRTGFQPVRDPTNLDPDFARGALRAEILPAVARHWPGYRSTLARFARQADEAAGLLREIAQADLEQLQQDQPPFQRCLRLPALASLPVARQTLVIRAWLAGHQLPMPSEARLQALRKQLTSPGHDTAMTLQHAAVHIRRYRDWAVVDAGGQPAPGEPRGVAFTWRGQAQLSMPQLAGVLRFTRGEHGVDPAWLAQGVLQLRPRSAGARLKLAPGSPSRSLKNLYQEHGIPAWQRERLPLLYRDDMLVHATGLGTDVRVPSTSPGIILEWVADRS